MDKDIKTGENKPETIVIDMTESPIEHPKKQRKYRPTRRNAIQSSHS